VLIQFHRTYDPIIFFSCERRTRLLYPLVVLIRFPQLAYFQFETTKRIVFCNHNSKIRSRCFICITGRLLCSNCLNPSKRRNVSILFAVHMCRMEIIVLPTRKHKTRLVTMELWSLTLSKLWLLGQTSSSSLSSMLLVLLTIWLLLAHHQLNCSNTNNYHTYNYDQTSQQFTPDGRVVQVEYASHAVEQSSET
jgi:hypothetical protein